MKLKLSRILQTQGWGTRRACIERIRAGEVSVNGERCINPDAVFDTTHLQFSLAGETWAYREKVYLALHKPPGYECSHQPMHHPSVFSLLPAPLLARGVQCVGRLDQDTTGLLLFTDDGGFLHRVTSPARHIEKTYEVSCKHPVDDAQLAALSQGVQLRDESVSIAALKCVQVDTKRLHMTIAEGKYHQVKRMVAAAGNRVEALHRIAIGGFALPPDLAPGDWCWLTSADLIRLEGHEYGSA